MEAAVKSYVQPGQHAPTRRNRGEAAAGGGEYDLALDLQQLHRECEILNQRIELAALRRRYSPSADEVEKATRDEQRSLGELDQLLTRIRLIERELKRLRGGLTESLH
jgi:hypothetical protein